MVRTTESRQAIPTRQSARPSGAGPAGPTVRRLRNSWPAGLFVISGATALVYQVIWSRMLVLAVGNTTVAIGTILSAFMAGMALGSWFWGRRVGAGPRRALLLFAVLEGATGLWALLFPLLLGLPATVEAWLAFKTGWSPGTQAAVRFIACFLLLLPATFFMGGTFPAISQALIREPQGFGSGVARLYGLNIAGALLGSGLAGFYFLRLWGHTGTTRLTALVNLLVALAAWLAAHHPRHSADHRLGSGPILAQTRRKTRRLDQSGPPPHLVRAALIAVIGSGLAALAYEVIWTRILILVLDNSVYSFTIILMAVLGGMALGSLILAPILGRFAGPALGLALVQICLGVGAFLLPRYLTLGPVPPETPYWLFLMLKMPWIILLPTTMMGATLPLAARIYHAHEPAVGLGLGKITALNTLGAVVGAILASLYLLPNLGLYQSCIWLPALNLALGLMLLAERFTRWPETALAVGLILAILVGPYLRPADFFPGKYARLEPDSKLIYYDEGLAAVACIFERSDQSRGLYLNGMPELDNSRLSLRTFKLMGALPHLLHPRPEKTLIVTFGAGVTAGMATFFADQVDCVDLVEKYREIADRFTVANNSVILNSKFHMFVDDARHFLHTRPGRYDVIISDATHPRAYDSWILFTREFYELVQGRLGPGGIFCQWVPFHGMTTNQYLTIIRTFQNVFPHASLWNVGGRYSLLVATTDRLAPDVSRLKNLLKPELLARDLGAFGLATPEAILSHYLLGEDRLRNLTAADTTVGTDARPLHLFFPYRATMAEQYELWPTTSVELVYQSRESIVPYLTNLPGTKAEQNAWLEKLRDREKKSAIMTE